AFSMYHVENLVEGYWNALSISQNEADQCKLKAANASCSSGIPCMFTETVVYETDPSRPPDKLHGEPDMTEESTKPTGMSTSNKVMAGSAIVAAGATAAAVMAFGNVGATSGNLQVSSALNLIKGLNFN
ncbi:unnamed protein product, partial [Symbiodinium microadriaticum]